jgi:hypothetical protein
MQLLVLLKVVLKKEKEKTEQGMLQDKAILTKISSAIYENLLPN